MHKQNYAEISDKKIDNPPAISHKLQEKCAANKLTSDQKNLGEMTLDDKTLEEITLEDTALW